MGVQLEDSSFGDDIAFERPLRTLRAAASRAGVELWIALTLDPDAPEDSFRLMGDNARVAVSGRSPRGLIYGLYELARQIRCHGWRPPNPVKISREPAFPLRGANLRDNPGEPPFVTPLRRPDVALEYGFNCKIIHSHAAVCTYDALWPEFYPAGSPEREWVLRKREEVRAAVLEAKRHRLTVLLAGDAFAFPRRALEIAEAVHDMPGGQPFAHRKGKGFCPASPLVQKLLDATYDELFSLFPEVDGILLRSGENDEKLEPTLGTNTPIAGVCDRCRHLDHTGKLALLVNAMKGIVCERHKKLYIQRAWSYWDGWHSQRSEYEKVIAQVAPDDRLWFSFKHSRTDYWRYNQLNPNLGVGPFKQCVELQTQREYEGKQAFPNYLGRVFADGATEIEPHAGLARLRDMGVQGAWGWLIGGGWGGPFLKHEDWIDVNVYAMGRLLWDPGLDPYDLVEEWTRLAYEIPDKSEIPRLMRSVMEKSDRAVLGSRYVRGVALRNREAGWTPCMNWFRDDLFSANGMEKMHEILWREGEVEQAIAEKAGAHEIYLSLVGDFRRIVGEAGNVEPWPELLNTVLYGEDWMALTRHYFTAIFEWLGWKADGKKDAARRQRALAALALWRQAWARMGEAARLPGAPTEMLDKGMVALCERAAAELGAARDPNSTAS